jgi:hypothetical protein
MLFLMLNVLYFYISTFRSIRVCAVSSMAVFCSSFILFFVQIFSELFWDGSSRPYFTGFTFVVTFHTRYYYYYYYYWEYLVTQLVILSRLRLTELHLKYRTIAMFASINLK